MGSSDSGGINHRLFSIQVRLTRGFHLPCEFVMHTAGPRYNEKLAGLFGVFLLLKQKGRYHTAAESALYSCYRSAFNVMREKGFEFQCIFSRLSPNSTALGCVQLVLVPCIRHAADIPLWRGHTLRCGQFADFWNTTRPILTALCLPWLVSCLFVCLFNWFVYSIFSDRGRPRHLLGAYAVVLPAHAGRAAMGASPPADGYWQ